MTSSKQGIYCGRNSSRVLRPPGGGSSNIFGCAEDEPKPQPKVDVNDKTPSSGGPQNSAPTVTTTVTTAVDVKPSSSTTGDNNAEKIDDDKHVIVDNSEKPADDDTISPSQQRQIIAKRNRVGASGFNLITGEPLVDVQPVSDSSKQNVSARQPPGGASSKLW